ncbi:U3 small nucleolar RNA-associated protein 4 homolog [Copidosoma floridanum]|uniref:U3 small nucleolar RNA-associated protein 4 homolog n=1 Tax=Copidosoma floridanum TaxID=29053 RepID=UPI0006C9CAF1|nr:U3 small nucleolar RNA-associated protein 4 homolog [Copidosoma floridanum]
MVSKMFCKVHMVRFYNIEPKSVTCFSYEPKSKVLALARNDYSIEIWNIGNAPFIEATIVGQSTSSIEAMLWIGRRLFSCGQRGMIAEYNLNSLGIRNETSVTGGPAWCMDINHDQTRLAVGTEDGCINTFFVTTESLIYETIFDKQKGRILSIKWDNTGEMIFSGSADTVRIWNATSGHAIHKILLARKKSRRETIVWCLSVTKDNMIISGDSRGTLSIWDPNMGTLIESHNSHAADILAMTLSDDKNVIYCAGVDPVIRTFCRINNKSLGKTQWRRSIERRIHIHDVRALVETNGKLYSAGVDGYLAYSSYPPKILVKYPPLLQSPAAHVCSKSKCILLRYHNYLELWKLGSIDVSLNSVVNAGESYHLDQVPVKLLELRTKLGENITACATTKDSRIIVYSTESHLRVFNFNLVEGETHLCKQLSDIPNKRVHKMIFSSNDELFVTANNDGQANVISLYSVNKEYDISFLGSFSTDGEKIKRVGLMCISSDNKYLVCADSASHIVVYNIQGDLSTESLSRWSLLKYSCPPTAMAIQDDTHNLVIVYSDHKIIEYSISKNKYTTFSNSLQGHLPAQWLARPFPIINIAFHAHNKDIIILHDDTTIFVMNKSHGLPNILAKIPKLENGDSKEENSVKSGSTSAQHAIQVVKKSKHLAQLAWLKNSELVAVEVDPISLVEKLPPTLKQKRFGI